MFMTIEKIEPFDITDLLAEFKRLDPGMQWTDMGHKGKQVGLQFKPTENPWTSAVGKSKGQELGYTELNPFFKGTLFEEVINKYNLRRTRLMWSGPFSCYSMHTDETPRLHIPLITNPGCMFLFPPDGLFYMPTGSLYWADTRKVHTFINTSDQPRLHLVGVVEK